MAPTWVTEEMPTWLTESAAPAAKLASGLDWVAKMRTGED